MLEGGFLAVFAEFIPKDLLVEFNGPGDGVVVPEIELALFLLFCVLVQAQHVQWNTIINYNSDAI